MLASTPPRDAPSVNAAINDNNNHDDAGARPESVISLATRYPIQILMAEDNPINRKLMQRFFEKLGFSSVDMAEDGRKAVEAASKKHYDLIFMDVQMPIEDGFSATRRIRNLYSTSTALRQPIVVALTAHAMRGDREQCLQAGMDDYLSKPLTLNALQATLSRWGEVIEKPVS